MGKEILIGVAIASLAAVNIASMKYLSGIGIIIVLAGSAIFADRILTVIAALP